MKAFPYKIVNISKRLCSYSALHIAAGTGKEYLHRGITERFSLLQRVDYDTGIKQYFHSFAAFISLDSSRVISGGMMPNKDFAISSLSMLA